MICCPFLHLFHIYNCIRLKILVSSFGLQSLPTSSRVFKVYFGDVLVPSALRTHFGAHEQPFQRSSFPGSTSQPPLIQDVLIRNPEESFHAVPHGSNHYGQVLLQVLTYLVLTPTR